jgi:hypothetical protein
MSGPGNPTTEIERDPAKLDKAMPWYVNGTLSAQDREWVEEQLEAQSRGTNLDSGISAALENRAKEVPANIAWDGLIAKVRADQQSERPVTQPVKEQQGPITRFFDSILSPRLGMAMAALLAVQTLTIGYLANENTAQKNASPYRSISEAAQIKIVRVVFAESASIAQIRDDLYDSGLVIVDGPNQFGEYSLHSKDVNLEQAAQALTDKGLIERFVLDTK